MIVALIQARRSSTRLPGKSMMDLGGLTVAERVLSAALQIRNVEIAEILWAEAYPEIAEDDVLARYAVAAKRLDARVIMRLTGDCPLFDPQVGALVLGHYMIQGDHNTYVSNVYPRRTWPDGLDCEVFSRTLLDRANAIATDPYDREHVTPWMQRHARTVNVTLPVDWSSVRLTVDTLEDLEWLRVAIRAPRS